MIGRIVVAALLATAPLAAWTQDYPGKPIKLLVTGAAGSPPDLAARWLGGRLSSRLSQAVVVENRPGAGGNIAMRAAAGSPPDGYTLVIAGQGPFALNPHMYENAGYDPIADFAPITLVERGPLLLAVHPAAGVTSVAELVKLAKSRPGAVNMGIPGTGTPPHMANELFVRSMGIEVTEVPYSGAAAAMADLMAGRLTYTFGALNVQLPQVKAGRIRALAVTSAKRMPAWPDIPTVAESGSPEFSYFGWLGLAAPARTPAPVIAKLHAELVKILHAAEAREYFETQGREPVGDTPAEFAAYIKTEYEKWGPIIRAAGIKAE